MLEAAVAQDRTFDATALRVYTAVCVHRGKDGWAWPSQATIAARLRTQIPKVSRAITLLRNRGFVSVSKRAAIGGHWFRNVYRLPIRTKSYVTVAATRDRRIRSTDLRVLIALGRWRSREGLVLHDTRPEARLDQIAEAARFLALPRRTVRDSVARLKELGAIVDRPACSIWALDGQWAGFDYDPAFDEHDDSASKAIRAWGFPAPSPEGEGASTGKGHSNAGRPGESMGLVR